MKGKNIGRDPSKQGYVLITMAIAAFAIFGAMGLAIDVGRLFILKNETQAYCDAAALAAALNLDGTQAGIARATSAALSMGNKYNIGSASLSAQCDASSQVTTNCVTVDFAKSQNGVYSSNPGSASGYTYARVQTTVTANLYFIPAVLSKFSRNPSYTQIVNAMAIGAQLDFGTSSSNAVSAGAMPYTAVSTDLTDANFGFNVGGLYDIQWPQFNANKQHCGNGNGNVINCFNKTPCAGDSNASMQAVVSSWGSSTNGYWGYQSNNEIAKTVLGILQQQPVYVGENLNSILTNGNKASEAQILDERASQDSSGAMVTTNNKNQDVWNNVDGAATLAAYFNGTPAGNGRRLFGVPVVYPGCQWDSINQNCSKTGSSTDTTVIGYGEFLLYSNGTPSGSSWYKSNLTGNEPFCAIYVGPWVPGSVTGGGGTSTSSGVLRVKLVQ